MTGGPGGPGERERLTGEPDPGPQDADGPERHPATEPGRSLTATEPSMLGEPVPVPPSGEPSDAELKAYRREVRRERYLIPALAVIAALAVGAIVIVFSDPDILSQWGHFFRDPTDALRASGSAIVDSYRALLTGALGSPSEIARAIGSGDLEQIEDAFRPLSEMIVVTTPLILAGLAVALPFRAGLFNIGAEGQITVGALVGAAAGFTLDLPGPLLLVVIVLASFIGGAIWAGIAGVLKATTGAHEVISTIMLNWIGIRLADYALANDFFQRADRDDPISKPVAAAFPRLFGGDLRVHFGIVLAIVVAIAMAYLLNRTTVGFEFRAVGANPDAARAAGMSPTRTYVAIMALAGGLAGLVGANQLASTTPSLTPGFSSGYGFDAIALALLGRAKPGGVVAAAFLFGILRGGSRAMQAATQTPVDIVVVIQALVIAFIAAPALVRAIFRVKAPKRTEFGILTKGW